MTENPDGTLSFATEEEAEYPWPLCQAYANALREQVDKDGTFEKMVLTERERHYKSELELMTERLKDATVAPAVAAILAREEAAMVQGQERDHLRSLLRSATYRGTDIRHFAMVDNGVESTLHEVPYLAMAWDWKTILAFPWREEGHINELELNAVAVFLRRRARFKNNHSTRFLHVLDSMVSRGCLAKGRSSQKGSVRCCGGAQPIYLLWMATCSHCGR